MASSKAKEIIVYDIGNETQPLKVFPPPQPPSSPSSVSQPTSPHPCSPPQTTTTASRPHRKSKHQSSQKITSTPPQKANVAASNPRPPRRSQRIPRRKIPKPPKYVDLDPSPSTIQGEQHHGSSSSPVTLHTTTSPFKNPSPAPPSPPRPRRYTCSTSGISGSPKSQTTVPSSTPIPALHASPPPPHLARSAAFPTSSTDSDFIVSSTPSTTSESLASDVPPSPPPSPPTTRRKTRNWASSSMARDLLNRKHLPGKVFPPAFLSSDGLNGCLELLREQGW